MKLTHSEAVAVFEVDLHAYAGYGAYPSSGYAPGPGLFGGSHLSYGRDLDLLTCPSNLDYTLHPLSFMSKTRTIISWVFILKETTMHRGHVSTFN